LLDIFDKIMIRCFGSHLEGPLFLYLEYSDSKCTDLGWINSWIQIWIKTIQSFQCYWGHTSRLRRSHIRNHSVIIAYIRVFYISLFNDHSTFSYIPYIWKSKKNYILYCSALHHLLSIMNHTVSTLHFENFMKNNAQFPSAADK
jgi:hypothetical protein